MKPSELITAGALMHAMGERKQTPAARLTELGLPGNKTEPYRHFAIKPLLAGQYDVIEPEQGEIAAGASVLIEDGVVTEAPKFAEVSLETNWISDPAHFDALYYLGHLMTERIIHIKASGDLHIVHRVTQPSSFLTYRIKVTVVSDTPLKVYETFETDGSRDTLMLYGVDAHVKTDASLQWVRHQSAHRDEAVVIGSHATTLGECATMTLRTFDFGTGSALHLHKIDLAEAARADVSHLLYAAGNARRGNVVNLRHNGRNARSNHRAKAILKDKATGIFNGLVRVDQQAKYASALQNSRAILLNDHAYMDARPQLEIYTDELEASHGSTTGQLDEAALFYLRSRGVSEADARQMLIRAFADDMIEAIPDILIQKCVRADFDAVFR